jgi:hypothetical protein
MCYDIHFSGKLIEATSSITKQIYNKCLILDSVVSKLEKRPKQRSFSTKSISISTLDPYYLGL